MDNLDTMAPKVDVADQQELVDIVQSSRFVTILAGLLIALFAIGKIVTQSTMRVTNQPG